jgi:hypothetical protein
VTKRLGDKSVTKRTMKIAPADIVHIEGGTVYIPPHLACCANAGAQGNDKKRSERMVSHVFVR